MPSPIAQLVAVAAFAALLPSVGRAADAPAPPPTVAFARDVVYCHAGGEPLQLDLAKPSAPPARPLPAVVLFHGGGWSGGNRGELAAVTWLFAGRGYAAASVGYRLAPAHPFPAALEDAKCAVRFLRSNAAQLGIDPERFGAAGFSAGGNLAMLLGTAAADEAPGAREWGTASSRVQAVVAFFAPTDLAAGDLPEATQRMVAAYVGGSRTEKPDAYRRASPLAHVGAGTAAMLLFQGMADALVPPTQAFRMAEALDRAGVAGRVELLLGAAHGDWRPAEIARTTAVTFAFFDEHLRGVPSPAPPALSPPPASSAGPLPPPTVVPADGATAGPAPRPAAPAAAGAEPRGE